MLRCIKMANNPASELQPYHLDFIREQILSRDISGLNLLEIGCGKGDVVRQLAGLANPPKHIIGIDLSINPQSGNNYKLMAGDAAHTGLPDNSIDLIYSVAVLEHLADIPQVLAESGRILKKGGYFVALVNPIWSGFRGHHYGPDLTGNPQATPILLPWAHLLLSPSQLTQYLIECEGFSMEECHNACNWVHESMALNRIGLQQYLDYFSDSSLNRVHFSPTEAIWSGAQGLEARFKSCVQQSWGLLSLRDLDKMMDKWRQHCPLIYKFTVLFKKEGY